MSDSNTETPIVSNVAKLTAKEAEEQYPGSSEFVSLHNHTIFSILDGVASPDAYFKGCAERKWPAFGITEHGVLSSIPDAYIASKETKVKQIVGCEFYYNNYEEYRKVFASREEKVSEIKAKRPEFGLRAYKNRHITVLAKNAKGYENLLKINKYASEFNFYYKPGVTTKLLENHKEGLIITSGCLNGPVSHEIRNNNIDGFFENGIKIKGAVEILKEHKSKFGEDFYVELQMPGPTVIGEVDVFCKLVELAHELKIKTILCCDSHYIKREDFELQKVMMAIDQGMQVDNPDLFHVNSSEQYFKTRYELRATFHLNGFIDRLPISEFEIACNNTLEINDKCEIFKPDLNPKLPKIDNAETKLRELAYIGLKNKGFDKDNTKYLMDEKMVTYTEQLEIELKRIIEKGFASYFLIILDLIKASTDEGMDIGPGRGSIAGSVLSYLIGIHSIDPLKWGTSFNRFMSPSRGGYMLDVQMPKE